MLEAAFPLPRRLLRAFNYPGILLEFRHSGDSWSLAWQHTLVGLGFHAGTVQTTGPSTVVALTSQLTAGRRM